MPDALYHNILFIDGLDHAIACLKDKTMNHRDKIHTLARAVIIEGNSILLCQTQDLEHNFYFVPGGHIEHEETAEVTLLREMEEEIGIQDAVVGEFLCCLEHLFVPGHNSICHNHEYNLFFRVSSPSLSPGQDPEQQEPHIKLSWHSLDQLKSLDIRPEPLKDYLPQWAQGRAKPFISYNRLKG